MSTLGILRLFLTSLFLMRVSRSQNVSKNAKEEGTRAAEKAAAADVCLSRPRGRLQSRNVSGLFTFFGAVSTHKKVMGNENGSCTFRAAATFRHAHARTHDGLLLLAPRPAAQQQHSRCPARAVFLSFARLPSVRGWVDDAWCECLPAQSTHPTPPNPTYLNVRLGAAGPGTKPVRPGHE